MKTRKNRGARTTLITAKGYARLANINDDDFDFMCLTAEQELVLIGLAKIDLRMVKMFLGAIQVLKSDIPIRLDMASHSFRGIAATLARITTKNEELAVNIYDR